MVNIEILNTEMILRWRNIRIEDTTIMKIMMKGDNQSILTMNKQKDSDIKIIKEKPIDKDQS